ncbi:MAG TPA: hypothetical protein VG944_10810 [Fimbriimonas sp.]|nr:hypothetical protein [Fimbriimonas sp.]
MFKKITLAAFTAAAVAALGQSTTTTTTTTTDNGSVTTQTTKTYDGNDWRMKYDTYHIGSIDLDSVTRYDMYRILKHEMRDLPAADQFELTNFMDRLPSDQSWPVLRGLVNNFKQASMVRDEVAMAQYGNADTYAWLSYPPLTWAETPGQNSWTTITMTPSGSVTSTTTTTENGEMAIAMTDDSSRPMRMVMAHRDMRDVDYDRAIEILKSGLPYSDRVKIDELFHPQVRDQMDYTNARALDSIIHVIDYNAKMADKVGRWAWYNHFDPNYYSWHHNDW